MFYAIQWIRSLIYAIQMYVMMFVIGGVGLPFALFNRKAVYFTIHAYCRWVMWTAGWMVGIKTEIRGTVPDEEILIAAKHQSFLDVLMIGAATPRPKFILKSSLMYMPILAQYAKLTGSVPVNRGRRTEAIRNMVAQVKSGDAPAGQLVIYPQGTRIAPGVQAPYKVGAAVLYEETGQRCLPVACNVGLFWGRLGIFKKPGTAVIEFLPMIESGLSRNEFLETLEKTIETASNTLMQEAGFNPNEVSRN